MTPLMLHQRLRLTQLRARKVLRRHWPVNGRCPRCPLGRTCTGFVRACVVLEALGDDYQPSPIPEPAVVREIVVRFRAEVEGAVG